MAYLSSNSLYVLRARQFLKGQSTLQAKATLEWMDDHPGAVPRWVQRQIGSKWSVGAEQRGCVVCGGVAHYRVGCRGFCLTHKADAVKHRSPHSKFLERANSEWNAGEGPPLTQDCNRRDRERRRRRGD